MTTKQQILRTLNGTTDMTDREVATTIGRPIPSVRRTRMQLENDGLVTVKHATSGDAMRFGLTKAGLAAARAVAA